MKYRPITFEEFRKFSHKIIQTLYSIAGDQHGVKITTQLPELTEEQYKKEYQIYQKALNNPHSTYLVDEETGQIHIVSRNLLEKFLAEDKDDTLQ